MHGLVYHKVRNFKLNSMLSRIISNVIIVKFI